MNEHPPTTYAHTRVPSYQIIARIYNIFGGSSNIDKAWSERDAALLREQNAQTQMHTMRDKLKQIEKETRKTETCSRDE